MKLKEKPYILGIDIGGTKLAVGVGDSKGNLMGKVRMETEVEKGAKGVIENVVEMSHKVIERSKIGWSEIKRVGISFGGPVDAEKGIVHLSHHVPGWENTPLVGIIEREFKVLAVMDNDANVQALGEWQFGAGRGTKNLVYLNIGTGIGGGIIIAGEIYRGASSGAGEIGHTIIDPKGPKCTCGKYGCLEAFASGLSIARRAREAMEGEPGKTSLMLDLAGGDPKAIEAETVARAAGMGDLLAQKVWEETVEYLSVGIGNVINILNPEMVIIGGGVAEAGKLLFEPLNERVKKYVLRMMIVKIVPGELGDEVGIKGAIALALKTR